MISVTDISNEENTCDLGYQIIPEYQNKGYMTEALDKVINFLLTEAEFYRISVYYRGNNVASKKVIEKCGLKYEGTFRSDYIKNGQFLDTHYYSIIKTDLIP